jgi:anti-sigma factor RsiW
MDQGQKDNLEFELSQYFDGELGGRRARRLERRLEQDPALQEELKTYAALDQQLSALAGKDLAGADYDWQRGEVVRMLERKRLLETKRRPLLFFRPMFWTVGGGLAVAAALVVGIVMWMSSAGPSAKPLIATVAPEVSVALVMPGVPLGTAGRSEATASLRKLDENDYKLMLPAGDSEGTEIASRAKTPPGTVMVSFSPSRPSKWRSGNFPFPAEF